METPSRTPTSDPQTPRATPRERISGPKREPTAAERHAEIESELGHRIAPTRG